MRSGDCKKCGKCCEIPTEERIEAYVRAGISFQSQYLSGCPYWVNGLCSDYEHRPQMCKDFPRSPVDIETLDCGYYFKEERWNGINQSVG